MSGGRYLVSDRRVWVERCRAHGEWRLLSGGSCGVLEDSYRHLVSGGFLRGLEDLYRHMVCGGSHQALEESDPHLVSGAAGR